MNDKNNLSHTTYWKSLRDMQRCNTSLATESSGQEDILWTPLEGMRRRYGSTSKTSFKKTSCIIR